MNDDVGREALERLVDRTGVLDRRLDDRQAVPLREVVAAARRVVVDYEDLVALIQQPIG